MYFECDFRISAYREYFQTIPYSSGIKEDCFELFIGHISNFLDIPSMKMLSIIFAFAQYRDPRETCLSSLKCEKLEKYRIVVYWNSPLFIMIAYVEWVGTTPRASRNGSHILLEYFWLLTRDFHL